MRKKTQAVQLQSLYEKLNRAYFKGGIFLYRVGVARFMRDYFSEAITYGMFYYHEKGSRILINKYLFMPKLLTRFPWASEVVLYHELCHAHLILNKYPARYGQYRCQDHGAEFWNLMLRHPKARQWEDEQEQIFPLVKQAIQFGASREYRRNPEKYKRQRAGL